MAKLAQPTGELARVLDLIAEARTIVSLHPDQDLIDKITMLQEYAEFSAMFPARDFGPVIRRGAAELRAILRGILESEEITGKNRIKLNLVLKARVMYN